MTSNEEWVESAVESASSEAWSVVDLSNRDLYGLPPQLADVVSVEVMNLSNNNLVELDRSIFEPLVNLRQLILNNNELRRFSSVVGHLVNLVELNLNRNNLKELPPTIGQCSNLRELYVRYNQLEYLPDEIGDCSNLETLNVGHNSIEELPASLGRLSKLERLKVDENPISNVPGNIISNGTDAVLEYLRAGNGAGGGGNAKRWAPSVRPAPKAKPSVKRVERSDSGGGGDGGGGDAPFDPASLLKNLRKVDRASMRPNSGGRNSRPSSTDKPDKPVNRWQQRKGTAKKRGGGKTLPPSPSTRGGTTGRRGRPKRGTPPSKQTKIGRYGSEPVMKSRAKRPNVGKKPPTPRGNRSPPRAGGGRGRPGAMLGPSGSGAGATSTSTEESDEVRALKERLAMLESRLTEEEELRREAEAQAAKEREAAAEAEQRLRAEAVQSSTRKNEQGETEYDEFPMEEVSYGRKLGAGAFGEVWHGTWNGTDVAIKKLYGNADPSEFHLEVAFLTKIRHPNVVLFMGASTDPDMCIVTEFCDQGALYDLIQSGQTLTQYEIYRVVSDTAKGMTYLHSVNIIHRDLKTQNLLVDSNWNIKVADFGLAKFTTNTQSIKSTVGTYNYMAPEVMNGHPYSTKADVYSYGICLWEIFTGQVPFGGMDTPQIVRAVDRGGRPGVIPKSIHPIYAYLIKESWQTKHEKRPTFSQILEVIADIDMPSR